MAIRCSKGRARRRNEPRASRIKYSGGSRLGCRKGRCLLAGLNNALQEELAHEGPERTLDAPPGGKSFVQGSAVLVRAS